MKNKFTIRIISAILCVAMLITTLPAIPLSVSAASAAGTEPVVTTDVEFHDGIDYEITRTTRYIGNRTYSVQIDVSADLSTFEHARIRTSSRNGYVTIQETGYYLIELWGGDGGDGQDGWTVAVIPVLTDGGDGAHGGYVYGKVFLKAGQTLVYNIGTNGDESTVYNDEGGGVNGDGGTHGDQGSYKVGGGGGYTAIYLFEEGEFDEDYVTETSVNIPETARLSRYLMIAGGGGGGGAGFTNLISNGTAGSPNGGMGGNINNGVSMSLLGDEYLVPGYVFSGRNGQSSGTSTEYVGRGGSNVPGAVSETLMGYFTQNQLPNDWTGTHNSSVSPGAGGSGNFRGGGGGSGYAGGSGGIMTAQLIASNVGGGGGGSSFVADEVNGQKIVFQTLTDEERAYLSGSTAQPVGANTGGAVQITYLSGAEDEFYQEALDNVTISATISRYFDVLSSSKTTGSNALSITDNGDTTYVKASGLSIIPASPAHGGKTASVTLFIRAKDEFMGGNGVQLIDGISADFLSPNDNTTPIHIVPSNVKAHKFVNVPLNATIKTKSYTSSQKGKSYAVSSLYEDDYVNGSVSIRDNLTSYWEYDHISAISTYRVYQNGTHITASSVAPTETTTYEVRYDVTPLIAPDSEVTVGPAIESPTTITGKAVISVVAPGTAVLNGLDVTGSKTLSYANGKYDFSVLINQESPTVLLENTNTTTTTSGSWTAPVDGWYYIQVWGGNGGSSGTVSCSGVNGNDVRTASAGSGGTGGYVTGYIYLSQGEVLSLTVGSAGSTGSNNTGNRLSRANSLFSSTSRHEVHQSWPGGGGGYSLVEMSGSPLLIAGGGGGAGSSVVTIAQYAVVYSQTASRSGGSVSSSASSTLAASLSSYNGSAGQRNGSGNAGVSLGVPTNMTATAGSAGTAGSNYRLSGMSSGYDSTNSGNELPEEAKKYAQQQSSSKNGRSGGQVAITLVATEDSQAAYDKLMDVETEIAISRYFDIESIDLATGDTYSTTSFNDNGDGSYTKIYKNASGNQVAKFSYRTVTAADGVSSYIKIFDVEYLPDPITETQGTTYYLHYESTLDFTFKLTPKDGFLGGNDVPVLAYGQIDGVADKDSIADYGVRVLQGDEFMNLPAADPTDFVNVENTVDMADYLTVQDKTIHLGDSVQKTELYTFTPPTYGADAWEDDYATFVSPGDETYTPTQTTDYIIMASFEPRIEVAQKATIVESLPAQEYSLSATVYVEVPVTTALTNLTCDNVDWTLWGESFGCTITPNAGYILPESIVVAVNGEETSNYTYSDSLGTVFIEGQYVTGPIVITAQAAVKNYKIYIVYDNYDAGLGKDVRQPQVEITGIQSDETIDWSRLEEIKGTINPKEGYEYQWVFENSSGEQPETMPAHNLWVYGSYVKASYPLTINYVDEDGNPMENIDSYSGSVVYGDDYSVVSPSVKGYLPDQTVVSGTMGAEAVTVTVKYMPSKNKLIILYQKETDGTLLCDPYEKDTVSGQTYTVNSPEFEGYETDTPVVTVKMEGEDTQTIIINYTPKKFTVTFDKNDQNDATLDMPETKLVEYDNLYSFNAMPDEDGKYVHDGLPTAQVAGYTFAGWFTEPECTNEVKESDTVKITADTTLYAKWERTKFKLTVRYDFLYENGDYVPEGFDSVDAVRASLTDDVIEIAYGDPYSVALPALTGYSAYENFGLNDQEKLEILSGTMPGQNMLVVISYEINTYEIKFMDLSGSHVNYSDKDTSTVASDSFDTVWKTVNVKHNVVPVYEEADPTPNHATREEYTYSFTGWYGSNDDVTYLGKTPTFPAVTSERNYYAMYDATENIVAVTYGSKVEYFTNVASALEFAETNISSGVVMDFRRNAGNERVLNLNDDTLVFGNTYTGTTNYTVTVDLNGIALQNTKGQSVVENTLRPLTIVISDSGAGGNISVSGDDDVIAIQSTTGSLTVNNQISVDVTSNNGDATGIKFGNATNSYTLSYANELSSVNVTAANGTACGIDVVGTSTVKPAAVNVTGKDAVGIRTNDGTALTLSGTAMALNVSGAENATGIRIAEGASLVNTVSNTKEQTVTSQGDTYGIYNEGALSSLNLKVTVNGTNNAYGIYNKAGTVNVTGIGSGVDLRATGTNGYGLYNEAGGAAIGAEDGDKLNKGAFAGSSYGIYSADNSIFASGNYLYIKGADESTALSGVVHVGYHQTDATMQFDIGYYRLATMRTIIFITNGGTEIATVTQLYDTPLDAVVTTKRGYTFNSWHLTEALDSSYVYPATMPDEDLVLYSKWDLNSYQYSLDPEFKEITVEFYDKATDGSLILLGTADITKSNNELVIPDNVLTEVQSYLSTSNSTLSIFTGWYSTQNPTVDSYAKLDGDISYLDSNHDFKIELYVGWYNVTGCKTQGQLTTSTKSFTINQSTNTSATTAYFMYYVVPNDGDYSISYLNYATNTSYRYKNVYIYVYSADGTITKVRDNGTLSVNTSGTSYNTSKMTGLKAGDVIVLRAYRGYTSSTSTSYNSTIRAYISPINGTVIDDTSTYSATSSIQRITRFYNVEMGTITLPVADNTGHEGMKFAGWADTVDAPKDERITQITPDMVDTVEEWQNGELWQLYSQWMEKTWTAYQSDKRDFTAFENTAQVNILGNDTVSIRFKSEQEPTEALTFKFANGLPAGTILTLIDRSGTVPVYYTYTTTDTTTELSSTMFVKMGVATDSFSGISKDVVLQICYKNTSATSTSETVSIYAGDVSEVDAVYGITPMGTLTGSNGSGDFKYNEEYTLNVTVPVLSDLGLNEEDKVLLRVRWDDVNLAPGSVISLNGMNATIYDGEYALLDTGFTVADMTAEMPATMSIYLPTMVQNEFKDKTFYYELCIAPNAEAAFGLQVHPLIVVTQELTLQVTPSLEVDAVDKTAKVGEDISVTVDTSETGNISQVEFYLYQQNSDGTFERTANCATVFETLTVADDGKLSVGDGTLVNGNTFTATVSTNAVQDKYYLIVKLGDKYERIRLRVVANTQ